MVHNFMRGLVSLIRPCLHAKLAIVIGSLLRRTSLTIRKIKADSELSPVVSTTAPGPTSTFMTMRQMWSPHKAYFFFLKEQLLKATL
jgi:hypothetical protein